MTVDKKAGLIPYYYDARAGKYKYLFMVSSDPKFGGPRPMISKGCVEENEDLFTTAIREAQEELGFVKENVIGQYIKIFNDRVVLKSSKYSYDMEIYAVEIQDKTMFDKPCFETKYTVWMTAESFKTKGRRDHAPIVASLDKYLSENPSA